MEDTYADTCRDTLEDALAHVPAYRDWRHRDPGPGAGIDARFAAMPFLTKADMRRHSAEAFVPAGRNFHEGITAEEIELVHTSGTTEERVANIWYQEWWDASEQASWQLNAHTARVATGEHPEAILTNPVCTGPVCEEGDLPMEARRLGRFLYLNEKPDPTRWTTDHMDRMVAELDQFRPVTLEANPSYLAVLARHITRHRRTFHPPAVVILTYEWPSRVHLRQIRAAFACPIVSSYGSTETGYVFMECEAGRFHQNTAYCRVDFQPFRPQHGRPDVGRIFVTPFHNPWYRLIRFNVADLVRLDPAHCPCGRTSGLTPAAMEGRARDVTFRADGTAVTVNQLDEAVSRTASVVGYQMEQTARDRFILRIVVAEDADSGESELLASLRDLYGRTPSFRVEIVPALTPAVSGKYRLARTAFDWEIDTLF